MALAVVALALGVAGFFLPVLPTVPFVLLAAFAAARGSERLHAWMRNHASFGPMLRDWEREGAVSLRALELQV
ncbi:YbaN family protein [Tahibacter sp.]|uniref:YbaN family protein n=1 Tax=Tahibacter sp. TaxID=2056211 RepID=UPI0028C44918|nr:YbaN family protein [Tahibacter sp.]